MKKLRPYQKKIVDLLKSKLKENNYPLLVTASVGAGKSLIIAEVLLWMEKNKYKVLCLTLSSTLVKQNANTYKEQGGNCDIYCSGLNSKESKQCVVFGTPHSVIQGIRNQDEICNQPFNLIVIDEAHNISPHDNNSMYQRIINHYGLKSQIDGYSFRTIGLTGTPYRGKSISIVGKDQFFKEEICNISTSWLIKNQFLVPLKFGIIQCDSFDYSKLTVNNMGKFNGKELQEIIDKNERLTAKIMKEIVTAIESGRNGSFIFAATVRHCHECAKSLPEGKWAIITGTTPENERNIILDKAKQGIINYLINVNCLTVGVDVPNFDTCAWLRPTESLVLYTQGIGRILRLNESKKYGLVLDYSGNVERHGDVDDPIINEAIKPKIKDDPDYCITCYTCNTLNKVTARRCIGIHNEKRCDHYFEFKECPECKTENDIVARECRKCSFELIDPNLKLKNESYTHILETKVLDMKLKIETHTGFPIYKIGYLCEIDTKKQLWVMEKHLSSSNKAKNIFYANFVKKHVANASSYYMKLHLVESVKELFKLAKIPKKIILKNFQIHKKIFD